MSWNTMMFRLENNNISRVVADSFFRVEGSNSYYSCKGKGKSVPLQAWSGP